MDKHDNIYHIWTKHHSPDECTWDKGAWHNNSKNDWEESCTVSYGTDDDGSHKGSHWRCMVCGQGTGNNAWLKCPYENTIEHIVAAAEKEVRNGPLGTP